MADLLPRLLSFSPQPHATQGVTDEYDKQIRDLIAYLKQSLLNKEPYDPEVYGLLDVSVYILVATMSRPLWRDPLPLQS